jgi:hypothetical protein
MEHRDGSWADLGKTLLIAGMGHGWVLLLMFLAIIATTYIAAFFLLSAIKGQKSDGIVIITPLLKIRTRSPDDHGDQDAPNHQAP